MLKNLEGPQYAHFSFSDLLENFPDVFQLEDAVIRGDNNNMNEDLCDLARDKRAVHLSVVENIDSSDVNNSIDFVHNWIKFFSDHCYLNWPELKFPSTYTDTVSWTYER